MNVHTIAESTQSEKRSCFKLMNSTNVLRVNAIPDLIPSDLLAQIYSDAKKRATKKVTYPPIRKHYNVNLYG